MNKGDSTGLAILILAVILVALFASSGVNSPASFINLPSASTDKSINSGGNSNTAPVSQYAKNIYLGSGNATQSYQSYEEYLTINNNGSNSINITGWQLKNGKDKRAYTSGSNLRYFSADTVTIPQASLFVSPWGNNVFQNVVLAPGESAVITTGNMGSQIPYKIVSFKENMCSGYLGQLSEYKFTPSLTLNCPRPKDEPGVNALDTKCRNFIERMRSCHTPKFDTLDEEGNICINCVDGTLLPSSCVAFIKERFNYGACIANYAFDPKFSGQRWRIFLGHGWELWADKHETIELFDNLGQLVNYRAY